MDLKKMDILQSISKFMMIKYITYSLAIYFFLTKMLSGLLFIDKK